MKYIQFRVRGTAVALAVTGILAGPVQAQGIHHFTGSGAPYIARYERAITTAKSMKIRLYTAITQHLPTGGDHSLETNVEMAREKGKIRGELAGPEGTLLVVGEGTTFWVYNRKANRYQKLPRSAVDQIQAQASQSIDVFPPGTPTEWTFTGVKPVSGHPCDVVTGQGTTIKETLYLDHTTHLPRRAEMSGLVNGANANSLMVFSIYQVNIAIPGSTFRWTPPAGATEVQPGK